jgi:hypothetical protein
MLSLGAGLGLDALTFVSSNKPDRAEQVVLKGDPQ